MLQQTTFSAVAARYEAFLSRFPDLPSLARSREDSVLAAWSGLGYYRRARNLRLAAKRILRDRGGVMPGDPEELRRLPGFGEYTAAAVAALAFKSRRPAADANVTRVVARLYGIGGIAGTKRHREAVLSAAAKLLSSGDPGKTTAALMDLGQLVCSARRPSCGVCPLASECAAFAGGSPERIPGRARKPRPVRVFLAAACARENGSVLLVRRKSTFLDGLWEFPSAEGRTKAAARERLAARLEPLRLRLDRRPIGAARHTIVNRRIAIEVFPASPNPESKSRNPESARWFTAAQLRKAAIPTLTRKVARAAAFA
ncbi:MAG TPA: NUDIX domain-containing protein [Thermoanaerobaculia bacterium]|nr:NUDIX domain-containing protein [Thermoanaerobaculia bacterium]